MENDVAIASIATNNLLAGTALRQAGIEANIGGSLGVTIFVPKEDAERAIMILKADSKLHNYWIKFLREKT